MKRGSDATTSEPLYCLFFSIGSAIQNHARSRGIVEPVFANICVQKRMHRFTLRSKIKVDAQWRLFALVHNIGKIHTYEVIH